MKKKNAHQGRHVFIKNMTRHDTANGEPRLYVKMKIII